jgi:hypothetical protein
MLIPILVLIGKRLKKIPILGKLVDERFLSHRRRAQRAAGLWVLSLPTFFSATAIS